MDLPQQFEEMRPYLDHEVQPAIERIVVHPGFKGVLDYLYEGRDQEELIGEFRGINSVRQFQRFFSSHTVGTIVEKTSDGLTHQGLEQLDTSKPYLFVANHRDIVLDAAIMQYLLFINDLKTSQITFGENLMTEQILLDLGKLNKMFTFYRGGSRIQQYRNAVINSSYINHVISKEKESIWIAQRNGRTKNGCDQTQTGLIKMLTINSKNICETLGNLNVVPVTISYEAEPCDIQKVRELYITKRKEYKKSPDEDFMSILAGITGHKGRIHYAFGTPMNGFIQSLSAEGLHDNDVIERVTSELDRQIYKDYRLWSGNYIAFDLLQLPGDHGGQYSEEEKHIFEETMAQKISVLEGFDMEEARTMFLQMYANPVVNMISPPPRSPQ